MQISVLVMHSLQKTIEKTISSVWKNDMAAGKELEEQLLASRWAVSVHVDSLWRVVRFPVKPTRKQVKLVVCEAVKDRQDGKIF